MSIDAIGAIGSSIITGVGATAASSTQLGADNTGQDVSQPPVDDGAIAQPDAAIVTISDEALAQQQATDQNNSVVQEAIDALDEASRENDLQAEADAIAAQQNQTDQDNQAARDAAANADAEQKAIVLAALNAGIQIAYVGLATPTTGDPTPRQPGLNVLA